MARVKLELTERPNGNTQLKRPPTGFEHLPLGLPQNVSHAKNVTDSVEPVIVHDKPDEPAKSTPKRERADFTRLAPRAARLIWGTPSSETDREWRWGAKGAKSLKLQTGEWYDHEAGRGGRLPALLKHYGGARDMRGVFEWLRQNRLIDDDMVARAEPRIASTDTATERGDGEDDLKERRQRLQQILDVARGVDVDAEAERIVTDYLNGRGISHVPITAMVVMPGDAVRLGLSGAPGYPCIVMPMLKDGSTVAAHVTTVVNGKKHKVQTYGEPKGAVIPLFGGHDKPLLVGEGIETVASAAQLTGYNAIAASSAGNLVALADCPDLQDEIIVLADNDDAGQDAATALATELARRGSRVKIATAGGDRKGYDWNDALRDNDDHDALRQRILEAPCFPIEVDEPAPLEAPEAEQAAHPGGRREETNADKLVALTADLYLFHDGDAAYADVIVDGHRETLGIRRKAFRQWLLREYYRTEGGAPNAEAVQTALAVIEAKAVFDGAAHKVFVRVGSHEGKNYLDLCDDKWRAVEIDADGWRVVESPPCRFRREKGMLALPVPERGGDIGDLKKLVNVTAEADFVLTIAWLAACVRDTGPYPVLDIIGGHGSAKSSLQWVLRNIVDSNEAISRSPPRDPHDLFIAASHSHVVSFDNLSSLPDWLSDALCRLATGGGYATRTLYTDRDEELFDTCRPIVINGIADVVSRPDLADRTLLLSLSPIGDDRRMREADLRSRFSAAHPHILGALLDIVATGLRNLPSTPITGLPRMADFAHFAQACEPAFAKPGTFMPAYTSNRTGVVMQMLEDDMVAAALCAWLANRHPGFGGDFEGSAGDVLEALNEHIPEETRKAKDWPKGPKAMSTRLRYLMTFLTTVGIKITPPGKSDSKRRLYTIKVTGDLSRYRTETAPEERQKLPKRHFHR